MLARFIDDDGDAFIINPQVGSLIRRTGDHTRIYFIAEEDGMTVRGMPEEAAARLQKAQGTRRRTTHG